MLKGRLRLVVAGRCKLPAFAAKRQWKDRVCPFAGKFVQRIGSRLAVRGRELCSI